MQEHFKRSNLKQTILDNKQKAATNLQELCQ